MISDLEDLGYSDWFRSRVDDEMLEEVLKMSLEEKQRQASSAEEEAEQIRKAMEWSMYDFKCEEYDRKRQGR